MAALTSIAAGITIAGAAVAGAGAIASGFNAMGRDTSGAADAAERIKNEQQALLNRETKAANKQNQSQFKQATENIRLSVRETNESANTTMLKAYQDKQNIGNKIGFASSGSVDYMDDITKGSVRKGVDLSMDKISLQAESAESSFGYGSETISIADARKEADIEERFQGRLAEIGSVADTFWEGIWGSDNEIKGYDYG